MPLDLFGPGVLLAGGVAEGLGDVADRRRRPVGDDVGDLGGVGALRTQAVCRFHRLLTELTPGGTYRGLRASRAEQLLAKLRPSDPVGIVRLQLAYQHLEDIRALDAKMKIVREQIVPLVEQTGSHLTELYGVGPIVAGRVLAEVADIARFPTRHHFASYNGTAPIDASSGDQVRHRLSRAGNRRLNHALHMMAVTQMAPARLDLVEAEILDSSPPWGQRLSADELIRDECKGFGLGRGRRAACEGQVAPVSVIRTELEPECL